MLLTQTIFFTMFSSIHIILADYCIVKSWLLRQACRRGGSIQWWQLQGRLQLQAASGLQPFKGLSVCSDMDKAGWWRRSGREGGKRWRTVGGVSRGSSSFRKSVEQSGCVGGTWFLFQSTDGMCGVYLYFLGVNLCRCLIIALGQRVWGSATSLRAPKCLLPVHLCSLVHTSSLCPARKWCVMYCQVFVSEQGFIEGVEG